MGRQGLYCGRSSACKRQKQGYSEDASVGFHDDGGLSISAPSNWVSEGPPSATLSLSLGQGLGGIGSYRISFGLPPFSLFLDTFHCFWLVCLHGRW